MKLEIRSIGFPFVLAELKLQSIVSGVEPGVVGEVVLMQPEFQRLLGIIQRNKFILLFKEFKMVSVKCGPCSSGG